MYLRLKTIGLLLLMMVSQGLHAQNATPEKKYELKLNGLYTILGTPEIGFEYLLSDETAIGLNAAFGTSEAFLDEGTGMFTPYHRIYFDREQRAAGFYLETSMSFFTTRRTVYDPNTFNMVREPAELQFGIGFASGWKFLTRSGWIGDVNLGLGRNLVQDDYTMIYPRLGISIGKRF